MKRLIKASGLISAAIAAAALIFVLYRAYSEFNAQRIRNWQEVVVFRVIEEAGLPGITFEDIRTKYRDEVTDFNGFQIPKDQIQSPALKRILLDLLTKHVVTVLRDGHYRILTDPMALSEQLMERGNKLQPVALALMDLLRTEGGKHSVSDLERILLTKFKDLTPQDVTEVISMAIANRIIRIDANGKVQNNAAPLPITQ